MSDTRRTSGKLDPAEKVARAAAKIIDSIGEEQIDRSRWLHERVKGTGGSHFITNGRLVALADAVEAWRAAR